MEHRGQKAVGSAAILLGLSDFGIELIDSWARWDMVTHLPHLGWLENRLVSPILIFGGMLLILRAREKEHLEELSEVNNPQIIVNQEFRPPRMWPWWRIPAILFPASGVVAILAIVTVLWFYSPPAPNPQVVPPAVPLAFRDWSPQPRRPPPPPHPGTSVIQTTTAPCSGNSLSGNVDNSNCNPPSNPYKPVVTYEPNGVRRVESPGNYSANGDLMKVFMELREKLNSHDSNAVLALVAQTKATDPGWFTLDLFSGAAKLQLCQTIEGEKDLNKFLSDTEEIPTYAAFHSEAQRILTIPDSPGYIERCPRRQRSSRIPEPGPMVA